MATGKAKATLAVLKDQDEKIADANTMAAATTSRQQGMVWVASTLSRVNYGEREVLPGGKAEEDLIEVSGGFASEPARVIIQKGLTLNLGNYESARVDIGIHMPCYPEEVGPMLEALNDEVEKRLQAEVIAIRKG